MPPNAINVSRFFGSSILASSSGLNLKGVGSTSTSLSSVTGDIVGGGGGTVEVMVVELNRGKGGHEWLGSVSSVLFCLDELELPLWVGFLVYVLGVRSKRELSPLGFEGSLSRRAKDVEKCTEEVERVGEGGKFGEWRSVS